MLLESSRRCHDRAIKQYQSYDFQSPRHRRPLPPSFPHTSAQSSHAPTLPSSPRYTPANASIKLTGPLPPFEKHSQLIPIHSISLNLPPKNPCRKRSNPDDETFKSFVERYQSSISWDVNGWGRMIARQRAQFWEAKPEDGHRGVGQGYWTSSGSIPGALAWRHLQKASQRASLMICWY